jgi:hypothetical protein
MSSDSRQGFHPRTQDMEPTMGATGSSLQEQKRGIAWRTRAQRAAFSPEATLVCLGAVAIFALPLLLDLALSPPRRAFGLVAADVFYYLVIGRNLGLHGMASFDGEHLTNGFQPLWQAIVALLYALRLPGTHGHGVLSYLVLLGVLCLALAIVLLAMSYRRQDGSLSLLFPALPFGLYALLVCPKWLAGARPGLAARSPFEGTLPLYGTLWAAVNGMETALVLLAFAALMLASLRLEPLRRGRHATLLGLLLAGLGLARLDHLVFSLVLWLNLVLFAPGGRDRGWWRNCWKLSLAFALPVALDLAVNRLVFGSTLPVSARVKSSAPQLTFENARHLARYLTSCFGAPPMRLHISWRVYQQVLPAIVALLSPLVLLRFRIVQRKIRYCIPGPNPARVRFLLATALGVLLLAAYDFFFVPTFGQGHWYFPVSILFVSLVALEGMERWRNRNEPAAASPPPSLPVRSRRVWLGAVAVVACAAASAFGYLALHRRADYHAKYADFYFDEAPRLRASFPGQKPKLFCFDDGIVEFATGFPSMSATGLALDAKAAAAKLGGNLAKLAVARGYTHLTSAIYVKYDGITRASSSVDLQKWAAAFFPFRAFADLPMRVAYRSQSSNFAIVEVLPRPE